MRVIQTKILRALCSPQFFAAVLVLFFIESSWIAISAAYPMVFDENVHFGVIQLYAHHWSPFFSSHFAYTEPFGALSRDPSFLYRYLLSFPYRLLAAVTSNQMVQIIGLRFINIFLFGSSLVLFRRLLLKTKTSPAIVHAVLLFFILTPVVPLLAGQINYDNMVMPITALALLLTVSVDRSLRQQHRLPLTGCLWLLTICLLGSVVQFEFTAVFGGIFIWLGWRLWRTQRTGKLQLAADCREAWQAGNWIQRALVVIPLIVAIGLFTPMYGTNLVRYHTLTPSCDQVLTAQQCKGSSAWVRAQTALTEKTSFNTNPALFTASWTYRMFIAMFYTSSGGAGPQANYLSVNPLPLIFITALLVFGAGSLLAIKYWRIILRDYEYIGILVFISLFYAASLLAHNYLDYLHYGQKFAINGRYLFPIAPLCMIIIALAFRELFGHRAHLKMALIIAVFLLFLQGGGTLTYITYSSESWYWQNKGIISLNKTAQQVIKPLIFIKTPMRSFGASD